MSSRLLSHPLVLWAVRKTKVAPRKLFSPPFLPFQFLSRNYFLHEKNEHSETNIQREVTETRKRKIISYDLWYLGRSFSIFSFFPLASWPALPSIPWFAIVFVRFLRFKQDPSSAVYITWVLGAGEWGRRFGWKRKHKSSREGVERTLTAKSISYLKCFWFRWFMISKPSRSVMEFYDIFSARSPLFCLHLALRSSLRSR